MKTVAFIISMLYLIIGGVYSQTYKSVTATYSDVLGGDLGADPNFKRGDPSDIIKVGNLYYVWYWKIALSPTVNYDSWCTWYATSPDGVTWTEKGVALPQGEDGAWDDEGVFTPGILVANNKYYLVYTGVDNLYKTKDIELSKTRIGIASSDSPDGPWSKLANNPIMVPSENHNDFDSHRMDDASLIIRNGEFWLYYKGRQWGVGARSTKMGLAIAKSPEGPYVKYANNPLIRGGHEVLVWPQGEGVATMIGMTGPDSIKKSIRYAKDGLHFTKTHNFSHTNVPYGPGAYRPEAFTDSGHGKIIKWGLMRAKSSNGVEYLRRYDLTVDAVIGEAIVPDSDN